MAPLNQVETLVCRCVPQCSTLGKIKNRPHMFVHPSGPNADTLSASLQQAFQVSLFLQIGKFQGYSFRQTFCQPKSFLIFAGKQIP